ncbi:MAG: isoprenylcysteine carboxylmethyltransferase family protein [Hyphomicrobiales bacterium]|nr:MAG: isoprenylcysteine carboxylmethyltransferase family protein [Hyphomicrobiales bacterium]
MIETADRPNSFPWPPVLYGVAILCAIALQPVVPLSFPMDGSGLGEALRFAGWGLLLVGTGFDISAMLTMAKARANILPHRAATALVQSGPFAVSRNPIYLGNTTMMVGAGLAFGNLWLIVTGLVAARLVLKLAIEREERHLEALFGPAWLAYRRRVRRWIGRRRGVPALISP